MSNGQSFTVFSIFLIASIAALTGCASDTATVETRNWSVAITEELGFSPGQITVYEGDTITIVPENNVKFNPIGPGDWSPNNVTTAVVIRAQRPFVFEAPSAGSYKLVCYQGCYKTTDAILEITVQPREQP